MKYSNKEIKDLRSKQMTFNKSFINNLYNEFNIDTHENINHIIDFNSMIFNKKFDITPHEFMKIYQKQNGLCPYTKFKLLPTRGKYPTDLKIPYSYAQNIKESESQFYDIKKIRNYCLENIVQHCGIALFPFDSLKPNQLVLFPYGFTSYSCRLLRNNIKFENNNIYCIIYSNLINLIRQRMFNLPIYFKTYTLKSSKSSYDRLCLSATNKLYLNENIERSNSFFILIPNGDYITATVNNKSWVRDSCEPWCSCRSCRLDGNMSYNKSTTEIIVSLSDPSIDFVEELFKIFKSHYEYSIIDAIRSLYSNIKLY